MASHYIEIGHTSPVLGAVYVRNLAYAFNRYRLRSFNPATGGATLAGDGGRYVKHLSLAELSHWHRLVHEGTTGPGSPAPPAPRPQPARAADLSDPAKIAP